MQNKFNWKIIFAIVFCFAVIKCIHFNIVGNKEDKPNIKKEKPTLIYLGDEIYSDWRRPSSQEQISISKSLAKSNVRGCGEYYIIEIRNSEYLLACTSDGESYKYITVWSAIEKAGELPSEEIQVKIKPLQ